jgi:hypothetical protein
MRHANAVVTDMIPPLARQRRVDQPILGCLLPHLLHRDSGCTPALGIGDEPCPHPLGPLAIPLQGRLCLRP